jgi:hypothetical protein
VALTHLFRVHGAGVLAGLLTLTACTPDPVATKAPVAAASSAAPGAGGVPVDYVSFNEPRGAPIPDLVADGFAGVRKLPETARLVGTAFALKLSESAAATTITPEQQRALGIVGEHDTSPPMVAPDGHEFLVTQLDQAPESVRSSEISKVVWTLRVGAESRKMPENFPPVSGIFLKGEAIVAVVPVGADAVLAAEEEGRAQTISLRTGQTDTGTASAEVLASGRLSFPTIIRVTSPDVHIETPGYPDNQVTISVNIKVALQLNAGGHPTAAPGRAWLAVQVTGLSSDRKVTRMALPVAKVLALRAAGKTLTVPSESIFVGTTQPGSRRTAFWIVDVPRDLTSIQVRYQFTGSLVNGASGNGVAWRTISGATATKTLKLD